MLSQHKFQFADGLTKKTSQIIAFCVLLFIVSSCAAKEQTVEVACEKIFDAYILPNTGNEGLEAFSEVEQLMDEAASIFRSLSTDNEKMAEYVEIVSSVVRDNRKNYEESLGEEEPPEGYYKLSQDPYYWDSEKAAPVMNFCGI